jgi:protein involved in polysaccharide export with SLBB domain
MFRKFVCLAAAGLVAAAAVSAHAQTTIEDILAKTAQQLPTNRQGQATEARAAVVSESAVGAGAAPAPTQNLQPYGASLFSNTGALTSNDTANPDYQIQPGDQISLRSVGGPDTLQLLTTVDNNGKIFIPEVGPVAVAGVKAGELNTVVSRYARSAFTGNVQIYAVVATTHKVGVFVGGFVKLPGRYSGSASDSVLDYLLRAGGVDPSRGSYRRIQVIRDKTVITSVDLYDFLQEGKPPALNLREGDSIFVEQQGPMVAVGGAVRNNYLFEIKGPLANGKEIIDLARPLPSATNVVIRGTRDREPMSRYDSLAQFQSTVLRDQDKITFVTDVAPKTVQVRVEGSREGPSVFVVDTHTPFPEVLAKIGIDDALGDRASAYILRKSIADQQRRVLSEARDRLERSLFLAISPTTGVSQIRASEAQLISSYLQRARSVEPDGRLVVTDEQGRPADIRLEDDDVIVIPKRSQLVMVSGEVLSPQAVVYRPGLGVEDYVRQVGGYSERGGNRFIIRRANGELLLDKRVSIRPGDELIILPKIDAKNFQLATDLFTLAYQIALSARVFQ